MAVIQLSLTEQENNEQLNAKQKKTFNNDAENNFKKLMQLLKALGIRHGISKVFSDFIQICAISISNSVDNIHKDSREKEYLQTVSSYSKEELNSLVEGFTCLVMILEYYAVNTGPKDVLGKLMEELDLCGKDTNQFFTPEHISEFMSKILITENNEEIERKGYLSVMEPCIGSGRMVLAVAETMHSLGYNYCSQLIVKAIDVDIRCVMMSYIQLSLYGIPAIIEWGDALLLEHWGRWYTPTYILNKWCWREGFVETPEDAKEIEYLKLVSEPMYAAFREIFGYGRKDVTDKQMPESNIKDGMNQFHFDFDLSQFHAVEQVQLF